MKRGLDTGADETGAEDDREGSSKNDADRYQFSRFNFPVPLVLLWNLFTFCVCFQAQ